jgi:ATP-independent RNA helicase DbpA
MKIESFNELNISIEMKDNLERIGYIKPTPIQANSIEPIIAGKDIIAKAKTGSGKTGAFGIGMLEKIKFDKKLCKALVLCPTRELASQVADELRKFAFSLDNLKITTLCGGSPIGNQVSSLKHGADVIVGTPGRIEKLIRLEKADFSNLEMLILDEADRMLDMGFLPQIEAILEKCNPNRQNLFFSATFPHQIKKLSKEIQNDPEIIAVDNRHDADLIENIFIKLFDDSNKLEILRDVLNFYNPENVLIFCKTKVSASDVAGYLRRNRILALPLHGDLEQRKRNQNLIKFKNGSTRVLIATDVAARGLDISGLEIVINFDFPESEKTFIHRIGRTARAGKKGRIVNFIAVEEYFFACQIDAKLEYKNTWLEQDEFKSEQTILEPKFDTICVYAGKNQKLRKGDIVGAFTKSEIVQFNEIGSIDVNADVSFIAIARTRSKKLVEYFQNNPIKGKKRKIRELR